MRRRIFTLLLSGILMMALFGCRTIHLYEYEYIEFPAFGGEFSILIGGRYGKSYEKNGKKMTDYGFPYSISFNLDVPGEDKLHKLVIKDIELVGEETGKHSRLQDVQSDWVRLFGDFMDDPSMKFIRVAAGHLTAEQHEYENYTLRATVVVYRDETHYESEAISVRLVTKYWKEYTNDRFDAFMDV